MHPTTFATRSCDEHAYSTSTSKSKTGKYCPYYFSDNNTPARVTEQDISIDDARAYELKHGINAPAGVGPRASLAPDAPLSVSDTANTTNESSTSVAAPSTAPSTSSATNGASTENAEPPRTLTFVELQALIEAGRVDEIPNNREIPDKFNVRLFSFLPHACIFASREALHRADWHDGSTQHSDDTCTGRATKPVDCCP